MKRLLFVILLCAAVELSASTPKIEMPAPLAARLDPVIDAMWSGFDMAAAAGHVTFISGYWRLPGNEGFDATLDRVKARLQDRFPDPASLRFEEYKGTGHGWDHSVGTLAISRSGKPDEVVLSRERHHIALCINSFSTPSEGIVAPLVDVGRGTAADFAPRDVKGAVILGDADINQLWQRGVVGQGALGVISTSMGNYVNPDPPGASPTPRDQWDIFQWGSIPYDETRHGFGFKASPHAASTLRAALKSGPVQVHVTIASTFSNHPDRMLIAEIPGSVAPQERIVIAAHVQEPGASDNASGVATLTELVHAFAAGIRSGRIPAPERTITFIWLNEIAGSRRWLSTHPEEATNVRYMFSMDMTGEDIQKTGGSFLIERWPDPGAVWDRAWDPHTEWGRGNVRAEQLRGDLINDLHLAVCQRVALKSDWVVNTNPYEGGSDHTVFGNAGVPSVLNWHFTDRYYHTNFDTADKTSAAEMRNVGVSVAASAWLMASANQTMALSVAELVAGAGQQRLAIENVDGAGAIVQAWKKWYIEAVKSVSRLVIGPVTGLFDQRLEQLATPFRN
jgi:aminopeptidase YwaD